MYRHFNPRRGQGTLAPGPPCPWRSVRDPQRQRMTSARLASGWRERDTLAPEVFAWQLKISRVAESSGSTLYVPEGDGDAAPFDESQCRASSRGAQGRGQGRLIIVGREGRG